MADAFHEYSYINEFIPLILWNQIQVYILDIYSLYWFGLPAASLLLLIQYGKKRKITKSAS